MGRRRLEMVKKKVNKQTQEPTIIPVDLTHLFPKDFRTYTMSVIEDRAIPDVRDGLKPVQRYIMYEMFLSKALPGRNPVKVKKISGAVIGTWHPHGDSSVEEAMVNMAAEWKNKMPPIYIHGNGGNILGDPAASGRYIESGITPTGASYGELLKEGIIPYKWNYDDTERMPEILPAQLPFLLINGADGIAVGEATTIPPHNPIEVVNAFIAYAKNNKISTEKLLEIMPGPDFPTHGTILNKDDLLDMYKTGKGKIRVRGRVEKDPKKPRVIHVYEVGYPSSGNVDGLKDEILAASMESKDKKGKTKPPRIPGIAKVQGVSGIDGIDIEITVKPGVDRDQIINELYAKTKLETTQKFNFNALNDQEIGLYTLKRYFSEYLEFQHEIVRNEHILLVNAYEKRLEIVSGLVKLQDVIDEVVASAKVSKGKKELQDVLMNGKILDDVPKKFHKKIKKFDFTEIQAEYISELSIHRINRTDYLALAKEEKQLVKDIEKAREIVENDVKRKNLIIKRHKDRLKIMDGQFDRLTKIDNIAGAVTRKIETPESPLYVAMDKYSYLTISSKSFDGAIETSNKKRLGFVDKDGTMWNLYLENVKETSGRGTLVNQLVDGHHVGWTTLINSDKERLGLFIFENGNVRVSDMREYDTTTKTTKVKSTTAIPVVAYYDIPEKAKTVTIDGEDFVISKLSKQGKKGKGRKTIKPSDHPEVSFK